MAKTSERGAFRESDTCLKLMTEVCMTNKMLNFYGADGMKLIHMDLEKHPYCTVLSGALC